MACVPCAPQRFEHLVWRRSLLQILYDGGLVPLSRAEFYLAPGFAGCELGASKISDRTRPFI